MAIGGESTGWSIHLDHPMTVKEKEVDSLEIDYAKAKRLAKLEDKEVGVSGKLTHRHGVETGERLVFGVSTIQEVNKTRRKKKQIPRLREHHGSAIETKTRASSLGMTAIGSPPPPPGKKWNKTKPQQSRDAFPGRGSLGVT